MIARKVDLVTFRFLLHGAEATDPVKMRDVEDVDDNKQVVAAHLARCRYLRLRAARGAPCRNLAMGPGAASAASHHGKYTGSGC